MAGAGALHITFHACMRPPACSIPGAMVLNAAVRRGCVCVSFDVSRAIPAELGEEDGIGGLSAHALHQAHEELAELVKQAAMDWAQQVGVEGQLAHGTSVVLQVRAAGAVCYPVHGFVCLQMFLHVCAVCA